MKKLMFAALAAVAVGAAYAEPKAYVYQVYMDIKTTQSKPCSGTPGEDIECGYSEGDLYNYVRVLDDLTIKGYIYLCHDGCDHLYAETQIEPSDPDIGYVKSNVRTANPNGEIFWETRKQAYITPIDGTTWKDDRTPVLKYRFLNVNNDAFDRCEGVFDLNACLWIPAVGGGTVTNVLNMVGAGFGLYEKVADSKSVWTRQTGLMAGTMTAPYMYNAEGLAIPATQAYGYVCGAACGGDTSTYSDLTAANGTFTISYNDAVSKEYGTKYCDAIAPFVPAYAKWL